MSPDTDHVSAPSISRRRGRGLYWSYDATLPQPVPVTAGGLAQWSAAKAQGALGLLPLVGPRGQSAGVR